MTDGLFLLAQIIFFVILTKTLGNAKLWNKLMDKYTANWKEPQSKFEGKAQMATLAMTMKIRTSVPRVLSLVFTSSIIFLILDFVLTNNGFNYMIIASVILILIVISRSSAPPPKPKLSASEMKMAGSLLKDMDLSKLFGGKNGDGRTGNDRKPDS